MLMFNKKEMAAFLEVNYQQYVDWENHKGEPNTDSLYKLWLKLKEKFPDMNLQDLLEP
jgi:DNA-binding XRE family transcriptional regulator